MVGTLGAVWRRAALAAVVLLVAALAVAATSQSRKPASTAPPAKKEIVRMTLSPEEWQKRLSPQQFKVLREAGTEPAFTGKYWNHHVPGTYICAGCELPLFASGQKFDSGTGWPSFWAPIAEPNVEQHVDQSFGMTRVEVLCARCGGHLGHVFDDGPKPTGLRYCINSAALGFTPAPKTK